MKKRSLKRYIYLLLFFVAIGLVLTGAIIISQYQASIPTFAKPFIDGFGGNLTSGIVGGLIFLPLAFFLEAQNEQNIEFVAETTRKRNREIESERKILHFEEFMNRQGYHNVRYPDLKENEFFGLEYLIRPVRDQQTGEPRKKVSEMESMFLVKVERPAHLEVSKSERKLIYETSPIRDDEFYYCRFFNDDWHMTTGDGDDPWYRFYLSSKVGPVEYGITANDFVSGVNETLKDMKLITTLHLIDDGTPLVGAGGCTPYEIYQHIDGNIYLRIWKSLPKKVYYTNPKNTFGEKDWELIIDSTRGYAHGTKLENVIIAVKDALNRFKLEAKKIEWYNLPDYKQLPKKEV